MDGPQITAKNWLMLAALGLVWGATFMVIEIALRGITPFWLATARIGFASALLMVIWLARGGRLFHTRAGPGAWTTLAFIGIFSTAVPFMLLSWGQTRVTSGFAGISMATVAIMVLPLAHVLVPSERLTLRKIAGFLVGFAGVAALIGPGAFTSSGIAGETAGRLACLAAAGCYALSSVQMQRLPPVDPIGLAAVQLVFGVAVVAPTALLVEGVPPLPDTPTIAALAVLGLLPTAAATLLRVTIIRSAGSTFMSLVNYIVPIVSVVIGALVLSEPVPASFLLALVLVLAGMGLSQWSALKSLVAR